jgi:transcriptional regulator with XRE-family HTH domain
MLTKQELSIKIGNRIKQLRKQKNISQAELGRLCGRDKQHIELIENHKVSANTYTLYTIALALDIDLKELFNFKK